MATDVIYEKISLWRTAWAEIKATKKAWWPWVAGFTALFVIIAVATQLVAPITELDRTALKQHPEMVWKYFKPLIPGFLLLMALYVVAAYAFTVIYLRHAFPQEAPQLGLNGFFFWFGCVFMKYLRPLPWLLLAPLLGLGLILYYRSVFRRAPVSPMAILRHEPVLRQSWELTENNVWRIIWGSVVLNLLVLLIVIGIILIPALVWGFALHGNTQSFLYIGGHALFRGFSAGTALMANAIYTCTIYRVLLREQKTAPATNPLSV